MSIMKPFLCAKILFNASKSNSMITYELDQVKSLTALFCQLPSSACHTLSLRSLRLWQQEKISELTMDVSKDLARDFHL